MADDDSSGGSEEGSKAGDQDENDGGDTSVCGSSVALESPDELSGGLGGKNYVCTSDDQSKVQRGFADAIARNKPEAENNPEADPEPEAESGPEIESKARTESRPVEGICTGTVKWLK